MYNLKCFVLVFLSLLGTAVYSLNQL